MGSCQFNNSWSEKRCVSRPLSARGTSQSDTEQSYVPRGTVSTGHVPLFQGSEFTCHPARATPGLDS